MDTHNRRHNFYDILVITILAAVCEKEGWARTCEFAQTKLDWLKTFLEFPNGIPSQSTFNRLFSLLAPKEVESCFTELSSAVCADSNNEMLFIDHDLFRGSYQKEKIKAFNLVSVWASTNTILFGQLKEEEPSNESIAVPALLRMIDMKDSIITVNAVEHQYDITTQIDDLEEDFVLVLRENQPALYDEIAAIFEAGEKIQFKKILNKRKIEKVHENKWVETRRYTLVTLNERQILDLAWPHIQGIGMLEVTHTENNEVTRSKQFFATTLTDDIERFIQGARQIRAADMPLHWSLAISFKEDLAQIRHAHATENLSIIKRIATTLPEINP